MEDCRRMNRNARNFSAIAAILVAGILANGFWFIPVSDNKPYDLDSFPQAIEGWFSSDIELTEPVLEAVEADDTMLRTYTNGAEVVAIYIGYHGSAKGGRPAHLPPGCYPSAGWRILASDVEELVVPANGEARNRFNRMLISKDDETQLVRYWFQSGDRIMATGWDINSFRILSRLKRKPYGTAFVRLSTPIVDNNEVEAKKLINSWTERAILFLSKSGG